MSISCPNCGRGYDVALFQFGRTLHCACGGRVGRLARWLRVLGYDTAYDADAQDEELVRRAVREKRVLLTRDRRLPEEWWIQPVVVVVANDPLEQLREVAAALNLGTRRLLFTRCTVCNAPLEGATPDAVGDRVPESVRREQQRFARCPGCGRIYWEGSHTARMRQVLARALSS